MLNANQKLWHRVIGASAIGPLHKITTMPCQDAFAFESFSSGYSVIAVADGLGSAKLSDFGARNAVDAAVATAKNLITASPGNVAVLEDVARKAARAARKELEEKADVYNCKLRDIACTLIVAIMYQDDLAVAHIGDGAVIARIGDELITVSGPAESEYANEVTPLTGRDWEKYLRVAAKTSNVTAVMAFTDGCQRAAFKKTPEGLIPFHGFCDPVFSFIREVEDEKEGAYEIESMLYSPKICNNSEDDKTLVVVVVNPAKGTCL